jgi:glycosyltransferase involved in cell wall biosynthesis
MNILFLESDQASEYNCSNWRCVIPARTLSRAGHNARVMRLEEWSQRTPDAIKASEAADLIMLQRNLFYDTVPQVFYWRARGKTVVVDLDDSYENMTEDTGSPNVRFWKDGVLKQPDGKGGEVEVDVNPKPIIMLRYGLKISSALTSPSKLILDDWKLVTPGYWVPNYVDLGVYRKQPAYHEPGRIRIGWGGSMTHLVSWTRSGAADALSQVVNENPNVDITLFGDPRIERFFKVKPKQRMAVGWIPQSTFPSKLNLFDIGLIPLFGEYDRRRSWIKTAEYSVMGIPWIGSDMEPTQAINTGMRVENTFEAWYNAISFYVKHFAALKDAAEQNVASSREFFGAEYHAADLEAIYERIIRETK